MGIVRELAGIERPPTVSSVLVTVLFTDIVDSTRKQAELGDRRWSELVLAHHSAVRTALTHWGGTEHDTAGDGFFASFAGPARAIHCAHEIAARVSDLGIETRAGVHIGECEVIDGKPGGLAVTIGARLLGTAGPLSGEQRGRPGPRSEATDGLTIERGMHPPRLVMLSRPQDFAALQAGTVRSHPLLTARFLRTDLETTRIGLATGRKLGGAVVRNRVRRRLREVLRAMAPSFQPGWDVLIIARPAIVEADHRTLVETLRRLLQRGGVLEGRAGS
jgi:ribonuclease P protein component